MTPATPDLPVVETEIIEMTNALRAEERLQPVARNEKLDRAARDYARLLALENKFAHDADGRGPEDRASSAGYNYCQIAENLALHLNSRGFTSTGLAELAMDGWINSPGHRRNLLAPHVTEIGIAVVRAPDRHPKFISVQLLGRPQSEAYSFQISNASKAEVTYELSGETHTVKPGFAIRHSECLPAAVSFVSATQSGRKRRIDSKYETADGQVYVVEGPSLADIAINMEKKRALSWSKLRQRQPTASAAFGGDQATAAAPPPLPSRSPRR